MFAPERVYKNERFGQLPSPDQKTRAINLPFASDSTHGCPPLGEGRWGRWMLSDILSCDCRLLQDVKFLRCDWIFVSEGGQTVRKEGAGVNSKTLVQVKNSLTPILS